MNKTKNKKYKFFDFPNKLTGLEQYYYYLSEFGIKPPKLEPSLVIKIFSQVAKDYLSGYLNTKKFKEITQILLYNHFLNKKILSQHNEITTLMSLCSDMKGDIYKEEKQTIKKLLKIFIKDPKKLKGKVGKTTIQ